MIFACDFTTNWDHLDVEIIHVMLCFFLHFGVKCMCFSYVYVSSLLQNVVLIEALKNIGGISYFPDYFSYGDLNLRKYQALHCEQSSSNMLHNSSNNNGVGAQSSEVTADTVSGGVKDSEEGGGDDEEDDVGGEDEFEES